MLEDAITYRELFSTDRISHNGSLFKLCCLQWLVMVTRSTIDTELISRSESLKTVKFALAPFTRPKQYFKVYTGALYTGDAVNTHTEQMPCQWSLTSGLMLNYLLRVCNAIVRANDEQAMGTDPAHQ